jgi:hypothetical protein
VDLHHRNVVVVTLDSCRYDTAVAAHTPNLDRLGPLLEAETTGTYTLPAHVALFTGCLPQPVKGTFPLDGRDLRAVWRSVAARRVDHAVGIQLSRGTLTEHYRAIGHAVVGAGGVTFFDPAESANQLPRLFDRFLYFGRPNRRSADRDRISDRAYALALGHVTEIAAACARSDAFFLFLNCASTHVPYTTRDSPLTEDITALLRRLYELHDSRARRPGALTATEARALWTMQVHALQWADRQLGLLFTELAAYQPLVIVCADHGESFGENGRYGHGHAHSSVTTVPLWCGVLGT